jgi:hypothetical protein
LAQPHQCGVLDRNDLSQFRGVAAVAKFASYWFHGALPSTIL